MVVFPPTSSPLLVRAVGQSYKNVYFSDYPAESSGRSSLTLAFGPRDQDIFAAVRHLTSDALRQALGQHSFLALRSHAHDQGQSINAFCISVLRTQLHASRDSAIGYLPGFEHASPLVLDPIQATFAGGRDEPLHNWYPYLEGYSPAFVEAVIGHYSPQSTTVFDPFAGTGTTPLTASRLGKEAFFSEINPVLQYLIASKVTALRLHDKERTFLAERLLALADDIVCSLDYSVPDVQLRHAYKMTFGSSQFFDNEVFEDVLQFRTLIDNIRSTDPAVGRFLTVAVLRSLIPASRLIRKGDLRFKTDAESARDCADIRASVTDALRNIALDIRSLTRISKVPILLLENAKNLPIIPRASFDSVITSPPYLNGTNYFRNTKVELWFLRCLKHSDDLARFRFASLTCGINDVTIRKPIIELPSCAEGVVARLKENAYDSRIPRMVACFASEMRLILQALADHTQKDGTIVIDIGDSAYAGVHVPTDRIVEESLDSAGFKLSDEVVLRQRYSRSRMKLTQKLLVFKRRPISFREVRAPIRVNNWAACWTVFKETLPHQKGDFAKRNWGHPLHSLCSYQGKMKPSLAAHLVRTFTSPGDRIVDPFSGVGTIPFEAALHGVNAWGFDISPPAVHITAGKIGHWKSSECENTVQRLENYLQDRDVLAEDMESARGICFNGALTCYFHEETLNEILLARRFFREYPPINASQSLVLACLLHILHGNRPYALSRRSHPITPFAPTGDVSYRALIPRLRKKVDRSLRVGMPDGFVCGHSMFQDATEWWPAEVQMLDAVLTSPPFYDSTRYYLGNWMRLWFCGWERKDFKERPAAFVDEKQKISFDVYRSVLRQARERLRPSGVVVLHLGASRKCDMATELARVSRKWFRVVDTYTECVSHCESHGIRDKGTVASHQYLLLQ